MPLLEPFLAVLAPHSCLVCAAEGRLLCSWCKLDTFPPLPSRCYRCQRLSSDYATCAKCLKPATPRHVWVVTDYQSTAKKIIHGFKFERQRAAAPVIGTAMSGVLPFMKPSTLVVPVPTATARIRQRGYDHAELLARDIAKHHQLQFSRAISRVTQSRQVGANRKLRFAQLKNAFVITKPYAVHGQDILLVDDVVTTGATLESVTTILKQAGAKTINAVVFAQKQ